MSASRSEWDDGVIFEDDDPDVRPYLVAGGATTSQVSGLAIESLVSRTDIDHGALRFESREMIARSARPISIAELSAGMRMPLGTTLALAGELISAGHLDAHRTMADNAMTDIDIMTRIINRVRQL